jgi:hypothetical protein
VDLPGPPDVVNEVAFHSSTKPTTCTGNRSRWQTLVDRGLLVCLSLFTAA